ncbi:MAG TPA: hypothetical protein VJZ27_17075, partial [Aggregatilineales bacterium]|nr:hypothetical protein [Aggregatilineales bacterium]
MRTTRVEQYIIKQNDPRWQALDVACFLSKNLYNAANYRWRQSFIFEHVHLSYNYLAKHMKANPDYCALPRKVSQWVLQQLAHAWQSWRTADAEFGQCPEKFTGRPRLPGYRDKTRGRNLLTYTIQAISKPRLKVGYIAPSGLGIEFQIGNIASN